MRWLLTGVVFYLLLGVSNAFHFLDTSKRFNLDMGFHPITAFIITVLFWGPLHLKLYLKGEL